MLDKWLILSFDKDQSVCRRISCGQGKSQAVHSSWAFKQNPHFSCRIPASSLTPRPMILQWSLRHTLSGRNLLTRHLSVCVVIYNAGYRQYL